MFLTSSYFTLLNLKSKSKKQKKQKWQTTETYSPQTFLVTAAVVAPAVVICLNFLMILVQPI